MSLRFFRFLLFMGAAVFSGCFIVGDVTEVQLIDEVSPRVVAHVHEVEKEVVTSKLGSENLSLSQALALVLERSPLLQSFSKDVRIGEARVLQAGLLPNPDLSFSLEDAFGPFGNRSYSQATLQLSQLIELGGKRMARLKAARSFNDKLNDEYEIKRVDILASVTDKFIRTVADEHLLRLAKKGNHLAKESLDSIRRRLHAGGASELEEARARVLVARSHIAIEHAEHELLSSKRELSTFWGEDNPHFSHLTADLFHHTTLPHFDLLSARIAKSPEIQRWASEKRLREAEKRLADVKAIPDVLLGAGPRRLHATDSNSWVFQVTMPLNIFDRNQGARKESELLSDKASIDMSTKNLSLRTTLFSLLQEANHSRTELEVMKSEIIPQAERSLSIAQKGYDLGRFSYLELLDAQRTLLEAHRENIEAAYSFHSFVNSIEQLIGSSLNENVK
jgi:outer membrane protein, heavy metal efflux system